MSAHCSASSISSLRAVWKAGTKPGNSILPALAKKSKLALFVDLNAFAPFVVFVLLLLSINCKAQSPIIDIIDDDGSEVIGAYYKDVNNLLNPFEGTYIYTSGSTTLKIVLVKKVLLQL